MSTRTRSPILFLVFNRPDTTQRVFDAIRRARPPRLYVAADGPRAERIGEAEKCAQVRQIATAVDWPCELITRFQAKNLGCKHAVSSAATWFFEHEAEGIVLEDDCLPDPSFFPYCDELLDRHRDDPRVMCISGNNFISARWHPEHSYYFSRYAHIWGWASWARAWAHYRVDPLEPEDEPLEKVLSRTFPESVRSRRHWALLLERATKGHIDSWDYQWNYALWKIQGLSCMPRLNLISNIGFGAGATNTTNAESKFSGLPVGQLEFPLRHPAQVDRAASADAWTEREVFGISLKHSVRKMVGQVLRKIRLFLLNGSRQAERPG